MFFYFYLDSVMCVVSLLNYDKKSFCYAMISSLVESGNRFLCFHMSFFE
jgi:hypothetical protein